MAQPTINQANLYTSYLAKIGKFRLRSYDLKDTKLRQMLSIAKLFGWDADDITAVVTYDTVFVRKWSSLSSLERITVLNHEAKHIAQGREEGWPSWYWQYFTDKEFRCNTEIDAYMRNVETHFLFEVPNIENYIWRIASRFQGPYFLDQKHTNRAKKHLMLHLKRLRSGAKYDAQTFWNNFLKV
jgi:hypothetical protein